ncbi:MAG: hypothetical protein HND54_13935 [Bacteroidetes bacterium]|nr:hypothetical protein [Bacteroidota bacterium]
MNLPKPKFCGQNWLDMKPTENGRICGGCDKVIFDFSKKKFDEISKIQEANNNSICGIYSSKQLKKWDKLETTTSIPNKLLVAASTLIMGLTQIKANNKILKPLIYKQSIIENQLITKEVVEISDSIENVEIIGLVYEIDSIGNKTPVPFVNLFLKHHKLGTTSDFDGKFCIKIPKDQFNENPDTLTVRLVGYQSQSIVFSVLPKDSILIEIEMNQSMDNVIAFYVTEPNFFQKAKWKVKNLFRKSN